MSYLKLFIDSFKKRSKEDRIIPILIVYTIIISTFIFAFAKPIFLFFIIPLFYLRVKNVIGFQKYFPIRLTIPVLIFTVLFILVTTTLYPFEFWSIVLGFILGFLLAYLGIKSIRFENREGSIYYLSNTRIQFIVLLTFFILILYRIYNLSVSSYDRTDKFKDTFTVFLFSVLFTFNIVYFLFILKAGQLDKQLSN